MEVSFLLIAMFVILGIFLSFHFLVIDKRMLTLRQTQVDVLQGLAEINKTMTELCDHLETSIKICNTNLDVMRTIIELGSKKK